MRIIAVDIGTSALKAALFNAEKFSTEAYNKLDIGLFTPKPGYVELKPEELWEALVKVVHDLINEASIDAHSIEAIVMDTQMAGVVAIDKDGTPLTNILTWLDSRAAGHPRKLFEGSPKVSGYNLLPLTRLLRISGGAPGKLGKDPLSKYAWLMDEQPDIYAKTWKFLDVKGYLLHRMTSKTVITVDEASITWLADTRNPEDVKWSRELIESFGLDKEKLPEIVKVTEVIGSLTTDAAKELNLQQHVKVVAGCGDVPATAIGSGGVEDFEVHLYIGTGNWFASHVPERRLDVAHYMGCILSAIPSRYLLVAEQQTGAIAIDYVSKLLGYSSYIEVDEDAAKVADEGSWIIFLPWLSGERSPVEDP
ncbi:MAG: FGGY family carbohydrate kinase, partial [Thermofilaceae archaeon]